MRVTRSQRGSAVVALIGLVAAGCTAPAPLSKAGPAALESPNRALVLGRIQLDRQSSPVQIRQAGPGDPSGFAEGDGALTTLIFFNRDSGQRFFFEVEDETGRFELSLPPGTYGVRVRYYTWFAATPAEFDVPEAGEAYYVGTLHVDLFQRRSLAGLWVRMFGGTIPQRDNGFSVVDDWEWARHHLESLQEGEVVPERRLMRLSDAVDAE